MSILIANKELVSNVAEYIGKALNMREYCLEQVLPAPDSELLYELWQCKSNGFFSSKKIYEKIFQLNIHSYISVYGEKNVCIPEYVESQNYKRMDFVSNEQICVNDEFIHFVKQLEFLIYNSDLGVGEDEISKKQNDKLYNALNNYLYVCKSFIVENMDSYLKYAWGDIGIRDNKKKEVGK